MNEPKRWLDDDAPELIGRMLRAAGDERPAPAALEQALAGVVVGAGVTGSAISTAGAVLKSAPLASGVFLKWTLLGTLATLGAGGLAVGFSSRNDQRVALPATTPAAPTRAAAAEKPEAEQPAAPDQAMAPSLSATPSRTPAGGEPRRAPQALKAAPDSAAEGAVVDVEALARETKLVDRARAELAAGRAASTLAALDEYQIHFPLPRYAPEALYLRMEALLSLGDKRAARQVATRLASRHPNSPHAARAEAVLSTTIP